VGIVLAVMDSEPGRNGVNRSEMIRGIIDAYVTERAASVR
jgi:metal-responsive CopG/Arc/MetJ family transcriptional regulator